MFIKRLLILVMMLFILLGCGKTVSSKEITYDTDKDLIVIKNTENKPFTGTIEHYDENGLFKYELKVKRGKVVSSEYATKIELSDLCSADYSDYKDYEELFEDTLKVLLKDIKVPFTGKFENIPNKNEYHTLNTYKDGKQHGLYISCYENGNIRLKVNFKDGKEDGEFIVYHENGNISQKANFIDGKLHGEVIEYHENGNIKAKGNYVDGKLHGEAIWYNENGNIQAKGNYVDGNKEGFHFRYDENGKPISKTLYKNGVKKETVKLDQ